MNEKAAKVGKSGSLGKIFGSDEFGVFLPLLGIIVVTTVLRPDFLSVSNFSAMLGQVTFIALTALGASFPLMVGQVDISTGRVAGFAGIIMSSMVVEHGMGALPAILLALVACLIVGIINGILVVYLEVPDFVATMGNASVPLSMMAVGIMIAKSDLKSIIMDKRQLLFMAINMLIIPILCIPVMRLLPIDEVSYGIFVLMMAMPVGSMAVLIEKEYGHSDGTILAQSIALSSVVSVVTIPIVTFLA